MNKEPSVGQRLCLDEEYRIGVEPSQSHADAIDAAIALARRLALEEAAERMDRIAAEQRAYAKTMLESDAPDGASLASHASAKAATSETAAAAIRNLPAKETP